MNDSSDAATRIWSEIEAVHRAFDFDRAQLGKLFWQLRNLHSDRNSGGSRLTCGHGTFEQEIRKRGFVPRRVREWIVDHEVAIGLRLPSGSTASKGTRVGNVGPSGRRDARALLYSKRGTPCASLLCYCPTVL